MSPTMAPDLRPPNATDVAPDVPVPPEPVRRAPPGRQRRRWRWALGALALVIGALLLTSVFGLPGPDPLRRYPADDLDALVDAVHAEAGPLRTPDDCWRTTYRASRDEAPDGPDRPIAAIDHLRSRVVVRVYADQIGRIDGRSRDAVDRRVGQLVAEDDRFEPNMVVVEASPDGWSPLMSCPLVVRGWL